MTLWRSDMWTCGRVRTRSWWPYSQFHQHFTYKVFVRISFWQLFCSYMYVVKAAKTTFVRKNRMFNVDEIDTWKKKQEHWITSIYLQIKTRSHKCIFNEFTTTNFSQFLKYVFVRKWFYPLSYFSPHVQVCESVIPSSTNG